MKDRLTMCFLRSNLRWYLYDRTKAPVWKRSQYRQDHTSQIYQELRLDLLVWTVWSHGCVLRSCLNVGIHELDLYRIGSVLCFLFILCRSLIQCFPDSSSREDSLRHWSHDCLLIQLCQKKWNMSWIDNRTVPIIISWLLLSQILDPALAGICERERDEGHVRAASKREERKELLGCPHLMASVRVLPSSPHIKRAQGWILW